MLIKAFPAVVVGASAATWAAAWQADTILGRGEASLHLLRALVFAIGREVAETARARLRTNAEASAVRQAVGHLCREGHLGEKRGASSRKLGTRRFGAL